MLERIGHGRRSVFCGDVLKYLFYGGEGLARRLLGKPVPVDREWQG